MPTPRKKDNSIYQAQAILARRDHSESEVRTKLKRKGFAGAEIEQAVTWLYANKLLNDTEFVRKYAESILLYKPVGPRWLQAKLRQRGVAGPTIGSGLEKIYSQYPEDSLAAQAADSWRRMHPKRADDKAALWRFLASRGFSAESINKLLSTN